MVYKLFIRVSTHFSYETHNATITGLETQVKEFEQKETDALKVKRDEQWTEIKNKLPPGLTHKEDDEKVLRGEWDTDPYTFSSKYVGIQNQEGRGESGAEFTSGTSEASMGTWDLLKKEWV